MAKRKTAFQKARDYENRRLNEWVTQEDYKKTGKPFSPRIEVREAFLAGHRSGHIAGYRARRGKGETK